MKKENEVSYSSLKDLIESVTKETYRDEGKGVLLSQLGEYISKNHPGLKEELGGKKLAQFIVDEMSEVLQIRTSPENRIVKIALPNEVEVGGDFKKFLPVRANLSEKVEVVPRYNKVFWAAFLYPLEVGRVRVVELEPIIRFNDLGQEAVDGGVLKVITPDFIVDLTGEVGSAKKSQRVNEKIQIWLNKYSVELSAVLEKKERSPKQIQGTQVRGETLLDALIAALDSSDLKRIQIPLDVVAKLNQRG